MTESAEAGSEMHAFSPTPTHVGPMLVAVDLADGESVLRVAHSLSSRSPSGVLAITVLPPLSLYALGIDPVAIPPEVDIERKSVHLSRLTKQVYAVVGSDESWKCRVIYDDPPHAIAELAIQINAPLIVMGIGRHRPLDRLLGAETTVRAIRHASCPVLAVTHDATAPMRSVVVTTDFSVRSARAAEAVLPLLAPNAILHVLHVWERISILGERAGAFNDAYEKTIPDRFGRFLETLALSPGVEVTWAARAGRPAEEILAFADDVQADLIVAGRHGRGTLATFFEGSVTQALLRGTRRSILIAPEPSYADVDRLSRLVSGASTSEDPAQWSIQLDAFSRRNHDRRTILEIDELALGAQVQERGYRLRGAAYDPHDHALELMLGGPESETTHVTRRIGNVDSVTVATDWRGRDIGLSIRHRGGKTLLTFYPG